MAIDLYYFPASAPCRAVEMLARVLGIELNLKSVNLMAKEQFKPDFLKLNPQHTVPTLVDDGFVLWESRAILIYLVEKYGGETTLYPSDPQKRAVVNQRLYFDMGTLFSAAYAYYSDFIEGHTGNKEKLEKVENALRLLDTFLANHAYVAGDHSTIADISLIATVSTLEVFDIDFNKYSNVMKWIEKMRTVPGYEINEIGLVDFMRHIESKRKAQKA